jgi:hypothetical protein
VQEWIFSTRLRCELSLARGIGLFEQGVILGVLVDPVQGNRL